jgi:hypothetical protein
MRMEFCNSPEDVTWLLETHLAGYKDVPEFGSFVYVGNEDSPEVLTLYESNDPHYQDKPVARYVLDMDKDIYVREDE